MRWWWSPALDRAATASSIVALVSAAYPVQVTEVTFVGEVVLMGWLLVYAPTALVGARHLESGDGVGGPPAGLAW